MRGWPPASSASSRRSTRGSTRRSGCPTSTQRSAVSAWATPGPTTGARPRWRAAGEGSTKWCTAAGGERAPTVGSRCKARRMHETDADLTTLQELLDRSYSGAGAHLRSITTPERRVPAGDLADRLQGMTLPTLATVTAAARPLAGPGDGIFYRGAFHFGSSPDSVRFGHLRRRPQVSATHLPAE